MMPSLFFNVAGGVKVGSEGANSNVVSSAHSTSSEAFGSPTTTHLAAMINDVERKMLDGKLVLLDDDRKPLTPKVDNPANADNEYEVDELFNETASFFASTSFEVNKSSKSGSGVGNKSLYEQWKETYIEDPYDDDDFDDCGLTNAQMTLANSFDINLRGQLR
ncbi:hypothetical protein Tco_0965239 [Tanacetum coccineum]